MEEKERDCKRGEETVGEGEIGREGKRLMEEEEEEKKLEVERD